MKHKKKGKMSMEYVCCTKLLAFIENKDVLFCLSQISFTITITADQCLSKTESFEIKPLGFTENLEIILTTECDCKCDDKTVLSKHCNNKGAVKCGICR